MAVLRTASSQRLGSTSLAFTWPFRHLLDLSPSNSPGTVPNGSVSKTKTETRGSLPSVVTTPRNGPDGNSTRVRCLLCQQELLCSSLTVYSSPLSFRKCFLFWYNYRLFIRFYDRLISKEIINNSNFE